MIRSELIQKIADENPHLTQRHVEKIVSTVFDEIIEALARGDRVELRGFGAFSVCLHWGKVGEMLPVSLLGGVFGMIAAAAILAVRGEPITASAWDMGAATLIGAVILALGMVMYTLGSKVIPAAELTLLSLIEVLLVVLGAVGLVLFAGNPPKTGKPTPPRR